MIKFKSISLQNFLSFGNKPTTIQLDTDIISMIVGENKDVGSSGYSKNGVGKSTIFQALTWVLFNQGISNIKQDGFINLTNKKNMFVDLELEVNGIDIKIRRGRKPNICEITRNGKPYTLDSISNNDEAIKKLLGIDIDIFLNTFVLTNNTIFMNMKGAEQRNFMERLLALHILSDRANSLKLKGKDNAVEIKLEEQNKIHIEQSNEKTSIQINNLIAQQKQWSSNKEIKILGMENELDLLKSIDIKASLKNIIDKESIESKIKIIDDQMKDIDNEIDKQKSKYELDKSNKLSDINKKCSNSSIEISNDKWNKTETIKDTENNKLEELNHYKTDISNISSGINEKHSELTIVVNDLKNEINNQSSLKSGKCPYCLQDFTSKHKVHDIESNIKNLETRNSSIVTDTEKLLKEESTLKEEYQQKQGDIKKETHALIDSLNQETEKLINGINDAKTNDTKLVKEQYDNDMTLLSETYNKNMISLRKNKSILLNTIPEIIHTQKECHKIISDIGHTEKELKQERNNIDNPYTNQINILKKDIEEYSNVKLSSMKEYEDHYKLLIKLLTDNKSFLRKNILDQYIPYINQKINGYLEQLESSHRIIINNDLSVDLEYMKKMISYGNLSNGERLRVNVAVSLSFRDLLSLSGCQTNLLCIDELLDSGGDSSFFYNVFKLLKNRQKESIFIISHRDELISEVDKVITIIKERGFSSIQQS
jgi:Straboviridae exonuclease subunit 2